jgi:hypothetical protein
MTTTENLETGITHDHAHTGPPSPRGWRSRKQLLAIAAAVAVATGTAAGALLASGSPASAATTPQTSWLMGAGTLAGVVALDPATASQLSTPTIYGAGASLTNNPIQSGYVATPVLSLTSYADFSSDIRNGLIRFPYKWVMYDPEKWDQTPVNEQQDPVRYMTLFAQLARAHGLKVIMAPAESLGYVTGSVIPRLTGEAITSWYVRTLAAPAGAASDLLDLQNESQTSNVWQYSWLFNNTAAKARAVNPDVLVFAEVSTLNGTTQQMLAAAQSVSADGYYVAAPNATGQAVQFFQQMVAAGY